MTLRPPQSRQSRLYDEPLAYEIAQEQAAALGRLGCALEAALAALSGYDRALAAPDLEPAGTLAPSAAAARAKLVQEAAYALWCFVIQREACGLRDQRLVMRDYRVPREVQNSMSAFIIGETRARRLGNS